MSSTDGNGDDDEKFRKLSSVKVILPTDDETYSYPELSGEIRFVPFDGAAFSTRERWLPDTGLDRFGKSLGAR